jgi:hypothetical protein
LDDLAVGRSSRFGDSLGFRNASVDIAKTDNPKIEL